VWLKASINYGLAESVQIQSIAFLAKPIESSNVYGGVNTVPCAGYLDYNDHRQNSAYLSNINRNGVYCK
jgi:hypothetical protein